MNCFYLGIDDSANEGTYVYSSDNSTVDSGLRSKILVANECGTDCDHLYTCYHATNVIFTIRSSYKHKDLVCEFNVNFGKKMKEKVQKKNEPKSSNKESSPKSA